jgi:hypothetical protein
MDSTHGRFFGLLGTYGRPRNILEVPKSPWIEGASMAWPRLHLHLYLLKGNLIFWNTKPNPQKILSW